MGGGGDDCDEDLMKLIWFYNDGDDDHDDHEDDGHVDDGDKDYDDYVIVDDYYDDDDNDSRVEAKSFIFLMSATRGDIMLTAPGWVAGHQVNIVISWRLTIFRTSSAQLRSAQISSALIEYLIKLS